MECKDIRKLLSPFVDDELGAHDAFTVAEHLEICPACQREMETLRRFDKHLRDAGRAPVEGVDELRTHILAVLSPWTWVRRWRSVGAAAAVLLFLIVGRQLFSAPSDPEAAAFSEALIAEMQLNATQPFSLAWLDPQSVRDVLRQEGLDDLPNLGPAGFHLEGARVCYPLGHVFIQIVYSNSSEEISLFVSRRWTRSLSGASKQGGFTIVPLGLRAVFLVGKESLANFVDVRQLAEEEINALTT
jgi:anti-sigma factor RsiW